MRKLVFILFGFLLLATAGLVKLNSHVKEVEATAQRVCFCHNVLHNPHTICTSYQGQINGHTAHVNNGEDTLGRCAPTLTPTPTEEITPTPPVPCLENTHWDYELKECVPNEEPTLTPTETPTLEVTPEVRGFSEAGAPQAPVCEAPTFAPTITSFRRVDSDTVHFEWTQVKDGLHTYLVEYGPAKDNLPYNVIVNGESVDINGMTGTTWARVAGDDNACIGPFSVQIDP